MDDGVKPVVDTVTVLLDGKEIRGEVVYEWAGQWRKHGNSIYRGIVKLPAGTSEAEAREFYRAVRRIPDNPTYFEESLMGFAPLISPDGDERAWFAFRSDKIYLD